MDWVVGTKHWWLNAQRDNMVIYDKNPYTNMRNLLCINTHNNTAGRVTQLPRKQLSTGKISALFLLSTAHLSFWHLSSLRRMCQPFNAAYSSLVWYTNGLVRDILYEKSTVQCHAWGEGGGRITLSFPNNYVGAYTAYEVRKSIIDINRHACESYDIIPTEHLT